MWVGSESLGLYREHGATCRISDLFFPRAFTEASLNTQQIQGVLSCSSELNCRLMAVMSSAIAECEGEQEAENLIVVL